MNRRVEKVGLHHYNIQTVIGVGEISVVGGQDFIIARKKIQNNWCLAFIVAHVSLEHEMVTVLESNKSQ